jgi:hypothetical protein
MYRLGLIVLLVSAVYGNTLNHGFVWDDNDIIVNNPLLEKFGNIPQFFLSEDKVSISTGYYRLLCPGPGNMGFESDSFNIPWNA